MPIARLSQQWGRNQQLSRLNAFGLHAQRLPSPTGDCHLDGRRSSPKRRWPEQLRGGHHEPRLFSLTFFVPPFRNFTLIVPEIDLPYIPKARYCISRSRILSPLAGTPFHKPPPSTKPASQPTLTPHFAWPPTATATQLMEPFTPML